MFSSVDNLFFQEIPEFKKGKNIYKCSCPFSVFQIPSFFIISSPEKKSEPSFSQNRNVPVLYFLK